MSGVDYNWTNQWAKCYLGKDHEFEPPVNDHDYRAYSIQGDYVSTKKISAA